MHNHTAEHCAKFKLLHPALQIGFGNLMGAINIIISSLIYMTVIFFYQEKQPIRIINVNSKSPVLQHKTEQTAEINFCILGL